MAGAEARRHARPPPIPDLKKGRVMHSEEVSARIGAFIREKYVGADDGEVTDTTALIALGILDSLNTVLLLGFIREELGVVVPAQEINAANFKNIQAITALVCGLANATAS
ncbi:hypothetical protein GCM10022254_31830 [Actinomadura meridiana]|uniref:Carrier domain-containing protein n=1 Tax=Actinomadura meridiana TaxID=559626 RepID=A0ABP8C279_9ACTN